MRLCGFFWSFCRVFRFRIFGLFLLFIICVCCSDFSFRFWVWWVLVIMYCSFMRVEFKLVITKSRFLYILFLVFFLSRLVEVVDRLVLKCSSVALLRFILGMVIVVRSVEVLFILTVVKTGAVVVGRDEGLELVSVFLLRLRFSGGILVLFVGIVLFIWVGFLDSGKLFFDLLRFRFDDDLDFDLDFDLWLEFNIGFCFCCVRGFMVVKSYGFLEFLSNWGFFGRLDFIYNFL